jgi:hypothetical protein
MMGSENEAAQSDARPGRARRDRDKEPKRTRLIHRPAKDISFRREALQAMHDEIKRLLAKVWAL